MAAATGGPLPAGTRPLRSETRHVTEARSDVDHKTYTDQYLGDVLSSVGTIAMVGASATETRPSFFVMKYLQAKGYRVIPVNPGLAGQQVRGETVYASLPDVPVPVDMVDIFRNSAAAGPITDEAIRIGAKVVWMQLQVRNDEAAARAEAAGLRVVMDRCPKMEYQRLHGELSWGGINSEVITNRRRPVKAVRKLM
jgi:predicted CoA-binding protein